MNRLLLHVALLALPFAATVQATHPCTTHKTVNHHVGAKAKVKTKHASGRTVYYCAIGNTVKYYASPGCRGLSRCGAVLEKMSLTSAQQRTGPCKWRYQVTAAKPPRSHGQGKGEVDQQKAPASPGRFC
ncbi:hypothetical protein [Hymenobacter ruricola]|uniref:Secreted protein n=1 Tax=Hymenobacter ruricola TaxID=2791023 RepID=A0ABS0IBA8_9BACT|nr:hypothetical protein [Hymenobacter ruricola]MBF9224266.1 hypothetical protein [Hymenobacter ruricola]